MGTVNTDYQSTIDQIKRLKTRVTVITPTYNRVGLITHVLESVAAQDYKEYVHIIIDDGSTDETKEVVQDFIKDKKNCFYVYQENAGEAEAVNAGWRMCKSEYFVQVNSDDTIEPDLFSEMVSVLDSNPKAIGAYPDFYVIDQGGVVIEEFKNVDWNLKDALSAFSCYPAAPGAFIRKSAFKNLSKVKDSRYKYINDIKMLWNMALTGDFIHVPKYLASWRSHEDSISSKRYKSISEVRAWADEFFSQKDLPEEVKEAESKCRLSIDAHCLRLIANSDMDTGVVDFIRYFSKKHQDLIEKNNLLEEKNSVLTDQKNELTNKIQQLEQSTSWRVTRPLRQASGFLKKVKGYQ